jgi:hypothetical protein
MSFFGGYSDAMQFNEQQRLREQADKRAERELAIREAESGDNRALNQFRLQSAAREQQGFDRLSAVPTERDAPMIDADANFFRSTLGLADNEQAQAFANLDPQTAARVMQAVRSHNPAVADSGRAWRAETTPDGRTRLGLEGKVRRSGAEIARDKADIMSSGAFGLQGITQSEDFLEKAVKRDREEFTTQLGRIRANPRLTDEQKVARYAEFFSASDATPGSYQPVSAGDGKFVLRYYDPATGEMRDTRPRTVDEIYEETLEGISLDNYKKLHEARFAASRSRVQQGTEQAQIERPALDNTGIRLTNTGLEQKNNFDSEANPLRLTEMRLRNQGQAETNNFNVKANPYRLDGLREGVEGQRLGNQFSRGTMDSRLQREALLTDEAEVRANVARQTQDALIRDGNLKPEVTQSIIDYRKAMGEAAGIRAARTGGGGGSNGKPGTIKINVLQPNGKYVKQDITVTQDADGNPVYTRPDGQPFTDTAAINNALGVYTEKERLSAQVTDYLAAARERWAKGHTTQQEFEGEQDRIMKRFNERKNELAFQTLDSAERVAEVRKLLGRRVPEAQIMERYGVTPEEIREAKQKTQAVPTQQPTPAAPGTSSRPPAPLAANVPTGRPSAIPAGDPVRQQNATQYNAAAAALRQKQAALGQQLAQADPELREMILRDLDQTTSQLQQLQAQAQGMGIYLDGR